MGLYHVRAGGGDALAVRDLGSARVMGYHHGHLQSRGGREVRRLSDFAASLTAGGQAYQTVTQPAPELLSSYSANFVLLGETPARWTEPDDGRPIVYAVEAVAPAVTGLDA